jgi:hypothetical protein
MSLEEALNRNTEMLERLCSIMGAVPFRAPDPQGYGTNYGDAMKQLPSGSPEKIAENIQREIDEAKEEVPNEQTKSSPATDTSPPSSNESQAVTYDDVKAVTIAVSKIDKAKAVAGLARFGAKNAKELQETQWSDYVVYMKRVAAGEIDPESSHE